MGISTRIMIRLAVQAASERRITIDVSRRTPCVRVSLRKYLKAHHTACGLCWKNVDD